MSSLMMYSLVVLISLLSLVILQVKMHLMASLLSLEVLMYMTILITYFVSGSLMSSAVMFNVLLCFAASGAAVGLALLIASSRLHGNDLISSLR